METDAHKARRDEQENAMHVRLKRASSFELERPKQRTRLAGSGVQEEDGPCSPFIARCLELQPQQLLAGLSRTARPSDNCESVPQQPQDDSPEQAATSCADAPEASESRRVVQSSGAAVPLGLRDLSTGELVAKLTLLEQTEKDIVNQLRQLRSEFMASRSTCAVSRPAKQTDGPVSTLPGPNQARQRLQPVGLTTAAAPVLAARSHFSAPQMQDQMQQQLQQQAVEPGAFLHLAAPSATPQMRLSMYLPRMSYPFHPLAQPYQSHNRQHQQLRAQQQLLHAQPQQQPSGGGGVWLRMPSGTMLPPPPRPPHGQRLSAPAPQQDQQQHVPLQLHLPPQHQHRRQLLQLQQAIQLHRAAGAGGMRQSRAAPHS